MTTRFFALGIYAGIGLLLASCTQAKPVLTSLSLLPSGFNSDSVYVQQVNSDTSDGNKITSDTIQIKILFSDVVTVTGSPRVLLEVGSVDKYATYLSGSGTNTLVFMYTVTATDDTADLDVQSSSAYDFNGGTLTSSKAVSTTLPVDASTGSLKSNKNIFIDMTSPAMTGPVTDGNFLNSAAASPLITWTNATDATTGVDFYQISLGTTAGTADVSAWSNIGNVTSYTYSGLSLTTGVTYYPSIRAVDFAGNVSAYVSGDGWTVDTGAPSVSSIDSAVTSASYGAGQTVSVRLNFTESVLVTGSPMFLLETGSTDRYANYVSGSGTSILYFTYTVVAGDTNNDLDIHSGSSLDFNGGSVTDLANNTSSLALPPPASGNSLGDLRNLRVDTTDPTITAPLNDGTSYPSLVATPTLTWSAGSDANAGSVTYELSLGTTSGGSELLSWTNIGAGASYQYTGLSLTHGTTYYASLRAVDSAGNYSSVINSDGWVAEAPWTQQAFIKASNNANSLNFGSAIDIDGDTLAVGVQADSNNATGITNGTGSSTAGGLTYSGAVFVYKRTGTNWAQEAYIKAPDVDTNDIFGYSVAISGDTLAVGMMNEASDVTTITNGATGAQNDFTSGSGAVYIYKRTGATWAQEAYIKAPNPNLNDRFGVSVAVEGDLLVVGADREDSNQTTITNGAAASADNSSSDSGAIYVYRRTGVNWAQEAYIKPNDTAATDNFGSIVSVSGNSIAVGVPAEDSSQTTITVDGATDTGMANSGAVYVYTYSSGPGWTQEAFIKTPFPSSTDVFGSAVAISGNRLLVGAPFEDSNQTGITPTAANNESSAQSGAAYLFQRSGAIWTLEAYFKAVNSASMIYFGKSLDLDGTDIAIGAYGESSTQTTITNGDTAAVSSGASGSGAVYFYKYTGAGATGWEQKAYIKSSLSEPSDNLGKSVKISASSNTIAAGAPNDDNNQTTITNGPPTNANGATDSGAVYIFQR